jgi:hypothetical protein
MSTIFHILKEEFERLGQAITLYCKRMDELPKGSIKIIERNKRKYAYLAWRENADVKNKYIAPVPSEKYEMMALQVKKRKQYVERVRRMKKEREEIRKALRNGIRKKI